MTYVIGGIKGGSGKSTIATNLTIELAKQGHDILLIDADDQATASYFTAFRNETKQEEVGYTSIQLANKAVRNQTLRLKKKYDHLIIDTGGRDTVSQRAAISVADIYLIPFAPRSLDIWTLEKVVDILEEMTAINPTFKAFSFINKADFQGTGNQEVEKFLKEAANLNFLPVSIGNRKAFANTAAQGLGVTEFKPVDKKAIAEFMGLLSYLTNIDHLITRPWYFRNQF